MDLNSLHAFVVVFEQGSIAGAAAVLGEQKSTISRKIAALEQQLNQQLFYRHANRIAASAYAKSLYQQTSRSLKQTLDGVDFCRLSSGEEGEITVSIPYDLAASQFMRTIGYFMSLYPNIRLNCVIATQESEPACEDYDVALIAMDSVFKHSHLVARKIFSVPVGIYGNPDILGPLKVEQAVQHAMVFQQNESWYVGDRVFELHQPRLILASAQGLAAAANDGIGVCRLADHIAQAYPALKKVVSARPNSVWVAYQHREVPKAARALIDFLIEKAPELQANLQVKAGPLR